MDTELAISVSLQEFSEFRHHSHQTSLDVCKIMVLKYLQLKNEPFYGKKTAQFSSGPPKLRLNASS